MNTNSASGGDKQVVVRQKKSCQIQSYFTIMDLKFGEMVVSDGVSVQTAPTAPHSFSRTAETCQRNELHQP